MATKLKSLFGLACVAALVLSGCNSTEDTIKPLSSDVNAAASPTGNTAAFKASIRFTPVIGAPIEAVTPLSRQFAAEAKNRGITIVSTADQGGDHVLKGYLSAFNDGTKTTIVYVWDVLDPAGNRLNRIQGQEEAPGASTDPWANVPSATMERIATRIFDAYQTWSQSRPS